MSIQRSNNSSTSNRSTSSQSRGLELLRSFSGASLPARGPSRSGQIETGSRNGWASGERRGRRDGGLNGMYTCIGQSLPLCRALWGNAICSTAGVDQMEREARIYDYEHRKTSGSREVSCPHIRAQIVSLSRKHLYHCLNMEADVSSNWYFIH